LPNLVDKIGLLAYKGGVEAGDDLRLDIGRGTALPSKSALAYRQLKQLIEMGDVPAGKPLTEARAAELVGMSRSPVRESLVRLEAEGLLTHTGVRQSRVVAYAEDQDPQEMLQRYELREQIESAAARLAAKNLTGWQIDQLRELGRAMEEAWAGDDREARFEVSSRFHHFLLANCGNPLLLEVWQTHRLSPLRPRSRKLDDRIRAEVARVNPDQASFTAVIDAIAAHDPDQAEELMRQRIRTVTAVIRKIAIEQGTDGQPGWLPQMDE
jgi:DNA-binding GntR family transcriptional regulator